MRDKLSIWGLVLLLGALIVSACTPIPDGSTKVVTVLSTEVTPEGPVDMEYANARNAALAYIGERYGEQAPSPDLAWTGENITPEGMTGSGIYQYTAQDWAVKVSSLVVIPDSFVYEVVVTNQATGFRWDGEVDATGQVAESPPRPQPKASERVLAARDAALVYLSQRYGELAPPLGLAWAEEYTTPEGLVGSATFEFTFEDWVVTISHAILPPERTVYQVVVTNQATGFQWEGKVDATGQVMEQTASEGEWFDAARARDAALAYVRQRYGLGWSGDAAPPELTWTEENITPGYPDKPVPGSVTLRYTGRTEIEAEDWVVTVSYAVLPPEQTIYQVVLTDQITGFQWEGEVDASGQVRDASDPMPEPVSAPDPVRARDAALAYVGERYSLPVPAPELDWIEKEVTAEGLVGSVALEYSALGQDWAITVAFPVVAPENIIYQVVVTNPAIGFEWQGEVDAAGQVRPMASPAPPAPTAGRPVVAWYGYVASTPDGAQFDDYLVLMPEGTGEIGLEGVNAEIEAEIVALRDKEEPGKYAHFWGALTCDILDYGGCQLLVTRLRPDGPGSFFDPDPVEGWEGTVYSGPPGPRSGGDDYFALVGDFNVQYGIWSTDSAINSQLESLRDTGTVIRVWGQVLAGIPDWNGTQIQVTRFEIVDEPSGAVPPLPDWPEADDGMEVYTNEVYGYRFRYPPTATITEFGVEGFPSDELPEGMSAEEYLAQLREQYSGKLCVQVEYALGYLVISAPPNEEGLRYATCRRTGAGVSEIVGKSEEVTIGGQTYTAVGYEFIGEGETLVDHNETLAVELEDGTVIEYGARPEPTATYEDYLMKGRNMLLRILASYEPVSN